VGETGGTPLQDKRIAYGMSRLHALFPTVNENFTGDRNAVGLEEILGFVFGQSLAALSQSLLQDRRFAFHDSPLQSKKTYWSNGVLKRTGNDTGQEATTKTRRDESTKKEEAHLNPLAFFRVFRISPVLSQTLSPELVEGSKGA
jgi:hypothetical protein